MHRLAHAVDGELHAPGQVGDAAEGLLVDKIAPPADALSQNHAGRRHVEHLEEGELFGAAIDEKADHPGQNGAVDGDAALPNGNHVVKGVVAVEGGEDIIHPGAHDGHRRGDEHEIDDVVLIQPVFPGQAQRQQHPQQKGGGDKHAVPVDLPPEDGEGHAVDEKLSDAKPRKGDGSASVHGLPSLCRAGLCCRLRFFWQYPV